MLFKSEKNKSIKAKIKQKFFTEQVSFGNKIKISKKRFTTFEMFFVAGIFLMFGVVFGCLVTLFTNSVLGTSVDSNISKILNIYSNISNVYYKDVDKSSLIDNAISAMISSLGDQYSAYLDEDETESLNTAMNGSFIGIGITIEYYQEGNRIIEVFDNSPAKNAGIQVGDVLLSVDDQDVYSNGASDISDVIKKHKLYDKISVVVKRGEEEKELFVTLKKIEIQSVSSYVEERSGKKVGYIYVNNFASNTYDQFVKNLKNIEDQKIDSLILDLRDNTGGHLTQATEILDLFFSKKTVLFQIKSKNGVSKYEAKTEDKRTYPVVILTNGSTASASEVVAACFRENYKNATIIGTTTYGKGTVQKTATFSDGTSYKFTSDEWLTPKGNTINEVGVKPDIEKVNDPNTEEDEVLEEAFNHLTK